MGDKGQTEALVVVVIVVPLAPRQVLFFQDDIRLIRAHFVLLVAAVGDNDRTFIITPHLILMIMVRLVMFVTIVMATTTKVILLVRFISLPLLQLLAVVATHFLAPDQKTT